MVGLGYWGPNLLRGLVEQPGVEVSYLCDLDEERLSTVSRRYPEAIPTTCYEDLLNAGVQIYHYNAPILLHSKLISVDDDIAVIGSSNLDIRSFQLNLEVTLVCYDTSVVTGLRQIESAYIRKSSLVNIGEWKTRTVKEKLFENISRLTAALQ